MGAVKNVLITGAAGYLGQEITKQALANGLHVKALVRRREQASVLLGRLKSPRLAVIIGDLKDGLPRDIERIDAVIHAAAHVGGGRALAEEDTLAATRSLLEDLTRRNVGRLVLISSISVYDYTSIPAFSRISEASALEPHSQKRDAYCRAKLGQEEMCRDWAALKDGQLGILRPGLLYGLGRYDNALVGVVKAKLAVLFGHRGDLPVAHVNNVARAAIMVVQAEKMPAVANVVDDELPSIADYQSYLDLPKLRVTVPWRVLDRLAWVLSPVQTWVPGLLRRRVLRARAAPFQFSNAVLKELGWVPEVYSDTVRISRTSSTNTFVRKLKREGAGA